MNPLIPATCIIFGGCCGNVITLEDMIHVDKELPNLLTFCQFVFIALINLPMFVEFENGRPRLKRLHIPFKVYLLAVMLFYLSTVGNNSIFQYNITIPIHITFRCFSTVFTMITSFILLGKRYTFLQIFSSLFLTVGAIIASLYKDHEFNFKEFLKNFSETTSKPPTVTPTTSMTNSTSTTEFLVNKLHIDSSLDTLFIQGMLILIGSSILMSVLQCYNEWMYKKYGKHWQENLFYLHLLSIPLFFSNLQGLKKQSLEVIQYPGGFEIFNIYFSTKIIVFFLNLLTQYFCIAGVNMLASNTDATTLSIVLLVRKFVSLILSVVLYKNKMSYTAYVGIISVFSGAFIYIWGSRSKPKQADQEK